MDLLQEFELGAGEVEPLGVCQRDHWFNFAVYAPDAKRLFVHFFLPDTEEPQGYLELKHRTGKVFHMAVKGLPTHWLYSLRAEQKDPGKGRLVNDKLLLDPYAKALNRAVIWNAPQYRADSPFFLPKSPLVLERFDWQGVTKPSITQNETILYETHIKGFSQLCPQVPKDLRGTYLGLAEPSTIEYLTDLGVTSVQLMPIFSFMSEPRLQDIGLTNYWGYNPVNFFAPDPRYAKKDAIIEFKTLVREFHRAGLEVILDVVYNHTAESGKEGPVLSFKGLAEFDFYLKSDDDYCLDYANYTGCGNTVNADSDFSLKLILDSLRYWLTEMQVDGFRFDLAATLGRNGERFNRRAALFRAMAQDPIISKAKLIAEPWDIGPEGYQLGNFPQRWLECNDKYRDGVRKFWRGERGMVAEVASRVLGSRDIFRKGKRSQVSSVNYVAYHDGFTLQDLVSYEDRQNLANLEQNRDGHGANYSSNYGAEGETTDLDIVATREQQKRNFIATLMFSQGVPHLMAGDEFSRTQKGNNNAYCQDNEISWINWYLDEQQQAFMTFVRLCIQIRKAYPVLQHCFLPDDDYQLSPYHHHINWIRPDGETKQLEDWHNHDNQCLGLLIADEDKGYQLLLILNASNRSVDYSLPSASKTQLLLDTANRKSDLQSELSIGNHLQAPRSMSLWELPLTEKGITTATEISD